MPAPPPPTTSGLPRRTANEGDDATQRLNCPLPSITLRTRRIIGEIANGLRTTPWRSSVLEQDGRFDVSVMARASLDGPTAGRYDSRLSRNATQTLFDN